MFVLFTRRDTVSCRAIRIATWSKWSHVAMMFGDRVYEARGLTGVRRVSLDECLAGVTDYRIAHLALDDDAAETFADRQVGKPYDWLFLIGFMLRRDIEKPDRWACSEYLLCSALAGGLVVPRIPKSRFTPEDAWRLPELQFVE